MPDLPTHDHYLRRTRFPSLDGLRCLAVLPVVWHHATPRPPSGLLGRGPLGVDLFFAISGFLITTLLLRERRQQGSVAVGRFYARRALRIFPAYYLVLGLTALRTWLFAPHGPTRDHFLHSLPYWATYTANWFVDFDVGHPVVFAFAWSLATEEQFYAVWPWLAKAPRVVMPAAALVLLAADQGVELGILGAAWPELARRMAASIASPICMGALLACALDDASGFAHLRGLLARRWSAPLALAALAALVVVEAPLVAVQAAMTLLVGASAVRDDHGLRRLLEARPVRFVGTISYALYLVHVAAITAFKRLAPAFADDAPVVFLAGGLALGLPLAYALHRAVDVPLQPLRARLRPGALTVPLPGATLSPP